jgi:hypothetical protein
VIGLPNSALIEISSRSTGFCHAPDLECVAIVELAIARALLEGRLLKWPISLMIVTGGLIIRNFDVETRKVLVFTQS